MAYVAGWHLKRNIIYSIGLHVPASCGCHHAGGCWVGAGAGPAHPSVDATFEGKRRVYIARGHIDR